MLVESIEWLIKVISQLKQEPDPKQKSSMSYEIAHSEKDTKERWRQLHHYSSLNSDEIPNLETLVNFKRDDEEFKGAIDKFTHFRVNPRSVNDSYYDAIVVHKELSFYLAVYGCETRACKQVYLYTGVTDSVIEEISGDEIPDTVNVYEDGEINTHFGSPGRGISEPLLKAVFTTFLDFVHRLGVLEHDPNWYLAYADWVVQPDNVVSGTVECWGSDLDIPQVVFLRGADGSWQNTAEGCRGYGLAVQDLDPSTSKAVLGKYLDVLDMVFAGEEWEELAAIAFIHDPASDYHGLYKPRYQTGLPAIILNLSGDFGELESAGLLETLVHEFAHHFYFSHTYVEVRDNGKVVYHPCMKVPSPKNCEGFEGPTADYLRDFWWDHSHGFKFQMNDAVKDYLGYYRLIDDSGAFVSTYSATNAAEDFAETFTAAVFEDYLIFNRDGRVVSEKLKFFQREGEPLTELVRQIRTNIFGQFEIIGGQDLFTNMVLTKRLVSEAKEELDFE